MRNQVNSALATLAATLLLVSVNPSHALQVVEVSDGVTVEAVISIKEPTRVRIDGAAITNVFGNIYSSNCNGVIAPPPAGTAPPAGGAPSSPTFNPTGEVVLECDSEKGEIYLRPVSGPGKPINLFVSSQYGTYTLVLRRSDTPADTIVIRDRAVRAFRPDAGQSIAGGKQPQHVRSLKSMLVAVAADQAPSDIRVEEVKRPIQLWAEANFTLVRIYEGRGLIGERYILTNISNQIMVLTEQEFDREAGGVLGVSIENHNLRPGESTTVIVLRQGA